MIRVLPFVVELAVLVYCMLDCVQTPKERIRTLPKAAWIGLIILLPVVGGVCWFIAGRPSRGARATATGETRTGAGGRVTPWPGRPVRDPRSRPGRRAVAPDDDDAFLSRIGREAEDERLLDEWEAEQRRLAATQDAGGPADAPLSDDESPDAGPGPGATPR